MVDRLATRIRWGFLSAFLLLLVSYIFTFYFTQDVLFQSRQLDHTNKVTVKLDLLQSSVTDAESGLRGYIYTGDTSFLDLYINAPATTDSLLNQEVLLVSEDKLDLAPLDTLRHLISNKFTIMDSARKLFVEKGAAALVTIKSLAIVGKGYMDQIRQTTKAIRVREIIMMNERNKRFQSSSNLIKVINIISLIFAILITFYSIVTFNNENSAKQMADRNAAAFHNQLELRITELNKANKELVELKSIEKFAATGRIARTIAHEVRNPLTNINLAAEHLKSEITITAETELLIDMITRNGYRINQLISDLLNSTKASHLEFLKHDVNDLLVSSLELARDRIDLKGVQLVKNFAHDICPVLVDAEKIQIALLNIIVNAIEAMEANKGILDIKSEHKNKQCIVTIKDNGKGMTQEELSNLFEPYFTTKENGTGLGLTNTQNIILSHKAGIHAESTPGKGTTFIITFNT